METNTIIILTAVLTFIFVFAVFFIMLIQRGAKNAKKGYVYTLWFNGCTPYVNRNEFNQHVSDLIGKAMGDNKPIKAVKVELIIESDGV